MEATEKSVGTENEAPKFRKCVYPYCRNMALPTVDYCEMHRHSTLLVKHPRLKNPVKKTAAAPKETDWIKVLANPKIKAPKKMSISPSHYPVSVVTVAKKRSPHVTIVLTPDEALTTAIALALADMIDVDRFEDGNRIAGKIMREIIRQLP